MYTYYIELSNDNYDNMYLLTFWVYEFTTLLQISRHFENPSQALSCQAVLSYHDGGLEIECHSQSACSSTYD